MTTRVTFTPAIREFLSELGYTHIFSRGIISPKADTEIEKAEHDQEEGDYILVPLKSLDPRITEAANQKAINEIYSEEVENMVSGDPFITFQVEIPTTDFDKYTG